MLHPSMSRFLGTGNRMPMVCVGVNRNRVCREMAILGTLPPFFEGCAEIHDPVPGHHKAASISWDLHKLTTDSSVGVTVQLLAACSQYPSERALIGLAGLQGPAKLAWKHQRRPDGLFSRPASCTSSVAKVHICLPLTIAQNACWHTPTLLDVLGPGCIYCG